MKATMSTSRAAWLAMLEKKAGNANLQYLNKRIADLRSEAQQAARQRPPTPATQARMKQIESQLQGLQQDRALLGQGKQQVAMSASATQRLLEEVQQKQQKQARLRAHQAETGDNAPGQVRNTTREPANDAALVYDGTGKTSS